MELFGLSNTNDWLAIILGGLFAYALGAVWYSPVLFAKQWQKAQPHRKKRDYKMETLPLVMQGFASFMYAVLLNVLAISIGLISGVILFLLYHASESKAQSLFLGQKHQLWSIDFGYRFFMVLIIAVIRLIVVNIA